MLQVNTLFTAEVGVFQPNGYLSLLILPTLGTGMGTESVGRAEASKERVKEVAEAAGKGLSVGVLKTK